MASNASLNGIPFHAGPSDVRWDFQMKVKDKKTLGGKVVQILGVTLGDMTISGRYAPNERKGDTEAWQEQERWRQRIKDWTREIAAQRSPKPIPFVYRPRGWNFDVYVTKFSGITQSEKVIAPEFSFTLHVLEQGTKALVKDTKDLYIERLMDGVGWKQTGYNGPKAGYVANLVGSGTVGDYLASQAQEAFESGLPGGVVAQ